MPAGRQPHPAERNSGHGFIKHKCCVRSSIDVNCIEKVNLFYTADTEYEDEEVSAIIDVEDYNTRIIKGSLVDFIIEW